MRDSEIERIGARLHREGLVCGNFGNVSVRQGEEFLIKRRGDYLDEPGELLRVPLEGPIPEEASRESIVHREIYQRTSYRAVVHAHPLYAIVASILHREILPRDCVGERLCPRIGVVEGASGSEELAREVSEALQSSPGVLVRGHGSFTAGLTLNAAYLVTASVEHACRVNLLLVQVRGTSR